MFPKCSHLWGGMAGQGDYDGSETTGFMSPAQDYVSGVIDLPEALDLRAPSRYLVRVKGGGLARHGILDGDYLVTDASLRPEPGRVVVALIDGESLLAVVERGPESWLLRLPETDVRPLVGAIDVWAVAVALVRLEVACSR